MTNIPTGNGHKIYVAGPYRAPTESLKAENIQRLKAVEVIPKGDLIVIAGNNEQGKTSLINSIALACGGRKGKVILLTSLMKGASHFVSSVISHVLWIMCLTGGTMESQSLTGGIPTRIGLPRTLSR